MPQAVDTAHPAQAPAACRLHFKPLSGAGQGVDVPCDSHGSVALDALGERLRNNYFFARACIGRLFAAPIVVRQANA